jgi:hypothetical protein
LAAEADKEKPLLEPLAKANQQVKDELEKLKVNGPRINPIVDETVAKVVGDYQFVAVIFSPYPVARPTPEGFKPDNIYAVNKDGKLKLLSDATDLEKLFAANAAPAKDEKSAKAALTAWLRLTQEFSQDGFFQFRVDADSLKVEKDGDSLKATGTNSVLPNNKDKGEIKATLTFDSTGKLIKVSETRDVQAGIRPKIDER